MSGPFEGIKVVELGQYVAAPYAAELLAHGGADVLKVEPVRGDITRFTVPLGPKEGRQYVVKARGKRGIPVDLRTREGSAIVRDAIAASDVVISNMRPGGTAKLGLDYETLQDQFPSLVYGEITGFGDSGPHAGKASIDGVAQASMGLLLSLGTEVDDRPGHHEVFLCDYMAGTLLAFGVATALLHRERTGEGQRVATSLAHAALVLQHRNANVFDVVDGWKTEVAGWVADEGVAAAVERRGQHQMLRPFFFTTYETSDGIVFVGAVGTMGPALCALFGLVDQRSEPGWKTHPDKAAALDKTHDELAAQIAKLSTIEVLDRLEGAGIPAGRLRFVEEVMTDEASVEAGLVYHEDHPNIGPMIMPSAPLIFSDADYYARPGTPALGEHTDQVLQELGYDQATIDRLVADGVVKRA